MRVTIYQSDVFCSDACLDARFEDGAEILAGPDVRRAEMPAFSHPRTGRHVLLEALLERATCDGCGLNLRDLNRDLARAAAAKAHNKGA